MGQLSGDIWASPPGGTSALAAAASGAFDFSFHWSPPLVFLALCFVGEDDFLFSFNLKRRPLSEYMLIKYNAFNLSQTDKC